MIRTMQGDRNEQPSTRAESSTFSSRSARSGEKLLAARAVWIRSKVEIGVLGAVMAGALCSARRSLQKIWMRLTEIPESDEQEQDKRRTERPVSEPEVGRDAAGGGIRR